MRKLFLISIALTLCSFGDNQRNDKVSLSWDEIVMIYEVGRTGCELETDQEKDLEELRGILFNF